MSSVTCNAAGLPPLARPGRLPRGRRWRSTTRATCGERRNVGRGWRVGAFPVWAFGFGHIAGCEAPAGPLHGPQKQMGEYRHVLGNMRLSVQFADAGRARHGRHRTSPALHVTRKTRSRRLAVAPLHHGAPVAPWSTTMRRVLPPREWQESLTRGNVAHIFSTRHRPQRPD